MASLDPRVTAFTFRRQALDGSARSAVEAVTRVVGVYAAMPGGALSVRARSRGAAPGDVLELERSRAVIRMRAMRTSAFLVPVGTAPLVAAATAVPQGRFGWLLRAAGIPDEDLPGVRAAILAAAAEPGTSAELRERLAAGGIAGDAAPWTRGEAFGPLLSLLTAYGDLVGVGGLSLSSNVVRYVDRRAWLGEGTSAAAATRGEAAHSWLGEAASAADPATDPEAARAWLAGEYLRAFGPARVEDLAWWAGWSKAVAETALGAHETVDVGGGLRLLAADVPELEGTAPLEDAVTLLPKWDAWTMGYPLDGRTRFLDMDVHDRVFDGDGNGLGMVLSAGRAIGSWAHRADRGRMQADVDLFEPVPAHVREAIEAELGAIAAFLGHRGLEVRDVPSVMPARRRQRRPLEPG